MTIDLPNIRRLIDAERGDGGGTLVVDRPGWNGEKP
jgi:hypothetical protein